MYNHKHFGAYVKKFTLPVLFLVFSASAFSSSHRFQYSADDLTSPEAIAELNVEIEKFARSYCPTSRSNLRFITCVNGIKQEIVEKISNSGLASYVEGGAHAEVIAAR